MSWYNNQNQGFIDATQILEGGGSGGGGASQTEINEINEDLTELNGELNELKEVFIPKQLNTENASLDTIIVNNTTNARIFIKNQNTTPKVKIEGGKLYLYYDYDITNAPTITAGWIDVDNYITAIKQQVIGIEVVLIPLEVYVFGTSPTQLQGQLIAINTLTGTHTGQIITLQEEVAGQTGLITELRLEVNYLNNSWFDPMSPLSPGTFNQSVYNQRYFFDEASRQAITTAGQNAMGSATARFGSTLATKTFELGASYLNYVLVGLGGIGVVVGLLFQLWDNVNDEANVKLERKILLLYEKLGDNPQNDLPKHIHKDGLLIIESTNNNLLSINDYTITLSNGGIIVIEVKLIGGVLKAFVLKVKEVGNGTFSVGDIINIPKTSIGGTSGDLQIQITSLISERQVLLNILGEIKISKDTSNNRRRLRDGIINTDELGDGFTTTYDTTITNEETGEVLNIPTIKVKLNTNQFETISGAIQVKPSFLGKGLKIENDKFLLDLTATQFDFIGNQLNIIGYDQALTDIATIQTDIININGNIDTIDLEIVDINASLDRVYKVLLPTGATMTDDYKLNLGYKEIFANYPYDLMMMAINPTSYTTFSTAPYNNDYLGYFPNMSRLSLTGDAKVIYDTQLTANAFQQFTKGFIYIKNSNEFKLFNMNRKFEFVSFLKFVSFNNNTTDYHLIQSGVDLGGQIEIDYSKLSVYIRNRKLIVKHPALVEYQAYQVSTNNYLTTYIVNNSYSVLTSSDDDILLRASPQLINNQTEYKYSFDMRSIGFYLLTTYAPNLIKVIDNGYTTEINNDTTYVAFYLSHPNDSNRPIANCVYPFLDLKIGQLLNGSFFDVSPTFIRRITLKFDIIYNTTLGQNYPDTKYQYDYAETTERCDFTFRITYSFDGLNFVEHNFSMEDVNPTFTETGTTYDSYFSNPNGQAIFPKRYWTYSFDIVGTYPDTGQKIRNLTFRLIPKPNSPYQYGTTASYLYNFQPILYLFKYIINDYNTTTSPIQAITTNYLTTNQSTALSSGILNSRFYLMTLQMDLPNNNIGFYVDGTFYNFTERLPIKLYPSDIVMPDPEVLFVNATFVSWANLTTDNSILVLGNIPSTGSIQFTHFNYKYFQSTEQFLTLSQIQKLMGLITYNYYYDYVSVDKLLDTNEVFANRVSTKQLVIGNNLITNSFTTALRTRDLRSDQTQEAGNVLIPIRNLYVENPTNSGNLVYNLSTKTFSIGSSGIGTRSEEDAIILGFIEDSAGFGLVWNNTDKTLNVVPETLYQDLSPIYTEINLKTEQTSNYVDTTSNYLQSQIDAIIPYDDTAITAFINTNDQNVSNYVWETSNYLKTDYITRDDSIISYISLNLGAVYQTISTNDGNVSNYVSTTSNLLNTDYIARDAVLNTKIDNNIVWVKSGTNISNNNTGNVNINEVLQIGSITQGAFNSVPRLVVYAADASTQASAIFKHPNNTQGIGIRYDGIFQTNTNANLLLTTSGTGTLNFNTNGSERMRVASNGNVGIGTTNPLSLLDINTTNYTGAILTLDAGIINATTQMARSIGKPLMKLGKTSYSTTAGDYYGIGFGYSPLPTDFNCAEIGVLITSVSGRETGDIVFSTRPNTTNVASTQRMRIKSDGNVGIGTTNIAYKLHIKCVNDSIASGLHLDSNDNGNANQYALTIYPYVVASSQVGWKFRTQSSSGGTNTPLTFNNAGNVGINKNPSYMLDVNGSIFGTTLLTTGNVGIGTTTTNERLTISGTTSRHMMLTTTTASTASYMGFSNSANDSLAYIGVDGLGLTNYVYGALTLGNFKDRPILFTTGATNTEKMRIENNGSVLIGATTNSSDDGNVNITTPDSTFYVRGARTAGATTNISFRGGLEGNSNGKVRIWLSSDAAHSSYIESHHTGNGNTQLIFGTANGNFLPTERMKIWNNGAVGIQNTSTSYAITNGHMSSGSLAIGNISQNYGGGSGWNASIAGLMLECADTTEIAVHDSGASVRSLMYYSTNGNITIGRDMGWGVANTTISGGLTTGGSLSTGGGLTINGDVFATTSRSVIRGNNPTIYLRDTDNRSCMLHCNSSIFYVLNGSGNDSETWGQQNGQDWALQINLNNNVATFGGDIVGNANITHKTNRWHTDSIGRNRFYMSENSTLFYSGGMSGGANARMHEWRRTYDDATLGWFENTGLFRSWGYSSLSDVRIKKNIRDIDDNEALEKILLIQPKKYNYVEKEKNKGNDIIGFIAQQIAEVIPEAVTKTEGIPPNIYKTCYVINKNEIYYALPSGVEVGIDVIITDTEDGEGKRHKITEIHDDYFVIDGEIDRDEAFVKGYSINDLHNLNKDMIFTLNVSASQELHRIIMRQKEEITDLTARLERMEAMMANMMSVT